MKGNNVDEATASATRAAEHRRAGVTATPGSLPLLGEVSNEELTEAIEASLREEGLLDPKIGSCFSCNAGGFDLPYFEGYRFDATVCEGCWEEAERIDELLIERDKPMVRRVQLRPRYHAIFLEPDEAWLVTPNGAQTLPYFPPNGSDEELRERADIYDVFR